MLQPAGKCPNVWTFAQFNPSQIPSNMAPLLRPKGILRAFQSAVHSPRGKACLASETTLANPRVLAGPRAQTFRISRTQSELLCASWANAGSTAAVGTGLSVGTSARSQTCSRLGTIGTAALCPNPERLAKFSSGETDFRSRRRRAHSAGARSLIKPICLRTELGSISSIICFRRTLVSRIGAEPVDNGFAAVRGDHHLGLR